MEEISTEQKQVLELAYYEGYSQSEIAELLKIPLGTVKTRMRQGMIKLSRHLKNLRYQPD
jgi:RNA polymerase sigma-70 factor (ECF subfamily)